MLVNQANLWYNGQFTSEVLEPNILYVDIINANCTSWFSQTEQGRQQGRLASTCTAHYTDLKPQATNGTTLNRGTKITIIALKELVQSKAQTLSPRLIVKTFTRDIRHYHLD